jgi:hypothetical protein
MARTKNLARGLAGLLLFASAGCRSVGPPRAAQDRFDYSDSLSRSWKEQIVMNLVRLRYADAPVFLDVASVISQYTLQGSLTAGGQFPGIAGNTASVGGAVQWSDRPTITFQPLTGQKFTKSLLTPIRPAAVMDLVQAGWPVDITFRVAVRAVNGVAAGTRNRVIGQAADPRFMELLDALRRMQQKGGVAVRVERRADGEEALLVVARLLDAESVADRRRIAEILRIDPDAPEYALSFGAVSRSPTEIALLTRSILEILTDLSFDVEVPREHEQDGRVGPPLPPDIEKKTGFRILSGADRPREAFAAVRYQNYWFWIDERDFSSKRALSFMLVLTALAETGTPVAPPAVTISTGP